MFSTKSRTNQAAATGKNHTIKNCRLCFGECDEEKGLCYNTKLPDLCSKYLHSSLTLKLSSGSDDQPFCPRCFGTAMELVVLSEQMEFIQKSISELVFMFSLDILHRRGRTSETQEISGKQLVEFDVSALPNCESWNKTSSVFNTSVTAAENLQQLITENVFIENAKNVSISDFTDNNFDNADLEGEIKCENLGNSLEVWIEEGPNFNEELTNNTDTVYLTDAVLLTNPEVATNSEIAMDYSERQISLENQLPTPILQLPKLKLLSDGKQIIAKEDKDNFMFNSPHLIESGKTVWTKSDSSSFRLSQKITIPPNEQWGGQLQALPINPISTEVETTAVMSSSSPLKRRRGKRTAKASQEEQIKEKPFRCSFCKKRFKTQTGMITHKMAHIGENPYECPLCPRAFKKKSSLTHHHKLYHAKTTPFKCTYCTKVFVAKWDLIRHVRTHTGEKPFHCEKCGYSAALLRNLKEHKIRHHAAVNYKCRECGKTFKVANDVKIHFKRVHFAIEFSDECVIAMD